MCARNKGEKQQKTCRGCFSNRKTCECAQASGSPDPRHRFTRRALHQRHNIDEYSGGGNLRHNLAAKRPRKAKFPTAAQSAPFPEALRWKSLIKGVFNRYIYCVIPKDLYFGQSKRADGRSDAAIFEERRDFEKIRGLFLRVDATEPWSASRFDLIKSHRRPSKMSQMGSFGEQGCGTCVSVSRCLVHYDYRVASVFRLCCSLLSCLPQPQPISLSHY